MHGVGDLWIGQAGTGWVVSWGLSWTVTVLLIGGAGWLLRAWWERVLRQQGPRIIYREINEALDNALRATGASVITAAETLQGRVRLYLGPIFDFNSAEGKALDKLRKALDGKIKDKADPAALVVLTPASSGPGAVASSAAAVGGAAAASAAAGGGGSGMQVGVITPVPPATPPGSGRDASTREHIIEVRGALEEFAVLWKAARVDQQLRRIQAALLITRPIGRSSAAGAWPLGKGA